MVKWDPLLGKWDHRNVLKGWERKVNRILMENYTSDDENGPYGKIIYRKKE